MKISHQSTYLQLIDQINLLIKDPKKVAFNKTSLNYHLPYLFGLLERKIVGIGFSFIELLFYYQKYLPLTYNVHPLLDGLNYDKEVILDEQTIFAIECYLGKIPYEELKTRYEKHYSVILNHVKTEFSSTIEPNSLFLKENIAWSFMTPLSSALYSRNINLLNFIFAKHPEWLEPNFLLVSTNYQKNLEIVIDPFLIALSIKKVNLYQNIIFYLKGNLLTKFLKYLKNELIKACSIQSNVTSASNIEDIHNFNPSAFYKSKFDLLTDMALLNVNLSSDDYGEILQATMSTIKENNFVLITSSMSFQRAVKNYDTQMVGIFLDAMNRFCKVDYLFNTLKNTSKDILIQESNKIQKSLINFYEAIIKEYEKDKEHRKNYRINFNIMKDVLFNYSPILKEIGALEVFTKLIKMCIKTYLSTQQENLNYFVDYGIKNKDEELLEIIFRACIRGKDEKISQKSAENLLSEVHPEKIYNIVKDEWQAYEHYLQETPLLLKSVLSFLDLPDQNFINSLGTYAIKYRRRDYFNALKQLNKKIDFNEAIKDIFLHGSTNTSDEAPKTKANIEMSEPISFLIEFLPDALLQIRSNTNQHFGHIIANTLFCYAANVHFATIQSFFKKNPKLLSLPDSYGRTPIHYAVLRGNTYFIYYYVSDTSAINFEDTKGFTALNYAYLLTDGIIKNKLLLMGAVDDIATPRKQVMLQQHLQNNPNAHSYKDSLLNQTNINFDSIRFHKENMIDNGQVNQQPMQIPNQVPHPIIQQLPPGVRVIGTRNPAPLPPANPAPRLNNNQNPIAPQGNQVAPRGLPRTETPFHNIPNNTHIASVHQSVAISIQALIKHYGDPTAAFIQDMLNQIKDYILLRVDALRQNTDLHIEKFFIEIQKLTAIDHYVHEIEHQFHLHQKNPQQRDGRIAIEEITKIPLFKILVLIWQAANDLNPAVNFTISLTPTDKSARFDIILDRFRRNLRGGNIDEKTGIDNRITDHPICVSGQVNNVIEALEGLHSLIKIIRNAEGVKTYFSEEANKLACEYFITHRYDQIRLLQLLNSASENPEEQKFISDFHNEIHTHVSSLLQKNVISQTNPNGLLNQQTLQEILSNLIYVDFEKSYFTDYVQKLANVYFKQYKDLQNELIVLFSKENLSEEEDRLVKRYYHDLNDHIGEMLTPCLISRNNPKGILNKACLDLILKDLKTIKYEHQPDTTILGKRKAEKEENDENYSLSRNPLAFFKKQRQQEEDLDQFAMELEQILKNSEEKTQDNMELGL